MTISLAGHRWADWLSPNVHREEQREEMTRDQALALLQTDEVLMTQLVRITTEHALKHIDAMEKEKAAAGE